MGELAHKKVFGGMDALDGLIGTGLPVMSTSKATNADSPSYWTLDEGEFITYTPLTYFSKDAAGNVLYSSKGVPIYVILHLDIYNLSNMVDGFNEWSNGVIAPAVYGKEITTHLRGVGTEYEVTTRLFDSETETSYGHSYSAEVTFTNISNGGYAARITNQTKAPYIGEWQPTVS